MKRQQQNKIGATPAKLAIVGVLAVILVSVVVGQLPESSPEAATTKSTTAAQLGSEAEEQTVAKEPTAAGNEAKAELPAWPKPNLVDLVAFDPFETPEWAITHDEVTVESTPEDLADLREQGVSALMIGENGKSAIIGEQKIRIGDVVNGFRVTDITAHGVVISRLDSR